MDRVKRAITKRAAAFRIVGILALALLAASCGSTTTQTGTSSTKPVSPPGLSKIEHFVFIMQENRSFDSYFGTYPGAMAYLPGSP